MEDKRIETGKEKKDNKNLQNEEIKNETTQNPESNKKEKKEKKNKKDKKIEKAENKTKKDKKSPDKKEKDKKPNKFIQTLKKRWLINGTKTTILVLIIIALFIGISVLMQSLDLIPLDMSQDKLYTLTDESKEKVKDVDKDVNMYFIGVEDDDSILDLAKQYTKENERINVEAINLDERPDIAQKYEIQSGDMVIIVECGDRSQMISYNDLYTYDPTTYETIDISEERLTAGILSTTIDEVPKIYFLSGYSDFSLTDGMQYLDIYLQNEINEVDTVDILTTGKVPDDCDTLIITTPNKDFDEITTNAIIDYINSGRNILWLNSVIAEEQDFPNVNKILAMYGVNPFGVGGIRETTAEKKVYNSPDLIMPELQYHEITDNLQNGMLFLNATKINLVSSEELANLNVEETDILKTSEGSYFRTNFYNSGDEKTDEDETGPFLVGAELEKTITEETEDTNAVVSKLIIFGENYFVSDLPLSSSVNSPLIQFRQNKDLVLNSIAYLSDREEDITARKTTGNVTYTATEQENTIILAIIFGVPILIIVIGIVVWIKRQRRK